LDYSYDRIARETARLMKIGADPFDVLRLAIDWSWQKLEFGWTHAYAGMADWLTLYHEHHSSRELSLVCLVESVAHVAYDVLREKEYPFGAVSAANTVDKYDATSFVEFIDNEDEASAVAAIRAGIRDGLHATSFVEFIDNEDEASAVAAIRAGIRDGLQFTDFESALTRAALLHYNDFGHSLIYVTKVARLIEQLGDTVTEPLLLSLVRGFIYASREDKIPEFRGYATQLARWGKHKSITADPALWRQRGINKSLQATVACSANTVACSANPPEQIYHALLLANAASLLSFDINQQDKIKVPVSGNVGWLDFTHGLTFANAVRRQCTRFPELWPQGLLQMACFNGRNAAFTSAQMDTERWCPGDPKQQLQVLLDRVMDHGEAEHIVSVHLLKTTLSVREEIASLDETDAKLLVAALTRFFESPLKRRQARRTAHQSLQFVARE